MFLVLTSNIKNMRKGNVVFMKPLNMYSAEIKFSC